MPEPSQLLRDIIDELRDTSQQTSKLRLGEHMIAKTVCRHAVVTIVAALAHQRRGLAQAANGEPPAGALR